MTTVLSEPILGYEVLLTSCDSMCAVCSVLAAEAAQSAWGLDQRKAVLSMYLMDDDLNVVHHEVTVHRLFRYVHHNEPF